MKILVSALSFLLTTSAMATPINMACVTEYPTTSFVGLTENDTINFRLIHHNGTKYMPIWSNVITPNDLPMLNEVAGVLSDLGTMLEFDMPEKNCETTDGILLNCFGSTPVKEIGGHKVSLWSVYTKTEEEESFAGTFSYVYTSFGLDIDGKSYFVPMKYAANECFQQFNAHDLKKAAKTKKLFL